LLFAVADKNALACSYSETDTSQARTVSEFTLIAAGLLPQKLCEDRFLRRERADYKQERRTEGGGDRLKAAAALLPLLQ
jgi:hypothetical protein